MTRCMIKYPIAFIIVILMVVLLSYGQALAIPSFARQTGMSCYACHTVFPELTAFGRNFKLGGYTFSTGSSEYKPPISAMLQLSFTSLKNNDDITTNHVAPFDDQNNSQTARTNLPQQASIFYGGRITDRIGAFAQLTYDGLGNDVALDITDVRFADTLSLAGKNFNYGFTINNSPGMSDVWNTTPVWRFPWAASAVAPTPVAAAVIDGGLNQMVGGIGGYASWADMIYAEFDVYRTTNQGITRPLGAGTTADTITDGAVPYWRVAFYPHWNKHYFEIGTYGLKRMFTPKRGCAFGY